MEQDYKAKIDYNTNKICEINMFISPEYLESEKHRSAGLEGQLNIITQDE